MTTVQHPQRRVQRRAELTAPVCVFGDELTTDAVAVDISTGGMGIEGASPFDVGAHVTVDFSIDRTSVCVEAEVAWSAGGRTGLRFRSLDPQALRTLVEYVAR